MFVCLYVISVKSPTRQLPQKIYTYITTIKPEETVFSNKPLTQLVNKRHQSKYILQLLNSKKPVHPNPVLKRITVAIH
jgi:hypothetical protein